MHFTTTFTILAMASTGWGWAFTGFQDLNCEGPTIDVNVWDNTCATPEGLPGGHGIRSFKVTAYGSNRQRAAFYESPRTCNAVNGVWQDWWADGGSDTFLKDRCIDLTFTAHTFGSRSA